MAMHLEVVTPRGMAVKTDAEEVRLPGAVGEFAVLEGHIPLLSALRPGVLSYISEGKLHRMAVGEGFAEVGAGDVIKVLTDLHAVADDVNKKAVYDELHEAEEELKAWSGEIEVLDSDADQWKEVADHRAVRARIEWAQARLELIEGEK